MRGVLAPPPLAGEEARRRARTLWILAGGSLLVSTVVLLLLAAHRPEGRGARLATVAELWVLTLGLLELNRRGWTRTASWSLVLGLVALATHRAWDLGGLAAPVTPLYVIFVMMAGVLLGARAGILAALVCLACGLGLDVAAERGALPPPSLVLGPRARLVYLALFMALTLLLQRLIVSDRERLVHELTERVKELRLLSGVARLQLEDQPSERALLEQVVRLVPAAWQFPECCQARIEYGGIEVATSRWRASPWTQSAEFATGEGRGRIDVAYTEPRPAAAEGPFLAEERTLLDSVAEITGRHLALRKHRHELEVLVATRTLELSQSLQRLRELERLRDDLVHMVVHDMRSPLMVLAVRLDQLRSHVAAGREGVLEGALAGAVALNRMAETLLDVSRLEQGKMPVNRVPCDLAGLASEVRAALGPLDPRRAIDVEATAPVTVSCDPSLVRRVIENLVGNAVKHTPAGGRLRVAVQARPGGARVTVRDEGEGVPAEARQRIFEKFGTVAARREGAYHSAGLGLAFCKLAVQAHGGTIGVDPVEPHGSLFWFDLPA